MPKRNDNVNGRVRITTLGWYSNANNRRKLFSYVPGRFYNNGARARRWKQRCLEFSHCLLVEKKGIFLFNDGDTKVPSANRRATAVEQLPGPRMNLHQTNGPAVRRMKTRAFVFNLPGIKNFIIIIIVFGSLLFPSRFSPYSPSPAHAVFPPRTQCDTAVLAAQHTPPGDE